MADLKTRAAALLASADRMTPGPWRPAGADADVIRSTDNRCREIVAANLRIDNTVGIVALRNGAPSLIGDLLAEIEKITAPSVPPDLAALLRDLDRASDSGDGWRESNAVDSLLVWTRANLKEQP